MSYSGATANTALKVTPSVMPASATALNTALAALGAASGQRLGGGRYVLPAGELIIDVPIEVPAHVSLEGQGAGTVLTAGPAMTGVPMVRNTADTDRRFAIRNLTLWGNSRPVSGISLNTPSTAGQEYADGMGKVQDVDILDVGSDALVLAGRGEHKITNVQIRDAGGRGIYVNCPDTMFNNVTIGGTGSHGVEIVQANNQLHQVKAYYCGLTDSGHGFSIHGTILNKLSQCEAQDCVGHGVYLNQADHCTLDVVVDSNGAGHGGRIFTGHGVVITDSDFNRVTAHARDRNANTTRQQWGLQITGWTSVISVDVMGQGNVLGTATNTTGNTISGRVNGVVGNIA